MNFFGTFRLASLVAIFLFSITASAAEITPRIAGVWKITKAQLGRASALSDVEAKAYIGKEVEQYKGMLKSPFGSCDFCGLSFSYEKKMASDLSGEFPGIKLKMPHGYALVHELTWGNGDSLTLIQPEDGVLYLPFEGAMFTLKMK